MDLETAAIRFQDAIVFAYIENCPLTLSRNAMKVPWWNRDLAEKRRRVRNYLMLIKIQGIELTTKVP
jgi:hypothetical protein